MIYFDNAATGGSKPYCVRETVNSVIAFLCANPTRSGHKLANAGAEAVFRCRNLLKEVFGCGSAERVIFTKNCTEALNTAIFGILKKGDHAVMTCAEHNSVLRPTERLKKSIGLETDVIYPEKNAYISQKYLITYDAIKPFIKKNTRLVITNHCSNVTGAFTDVKGIGEGLKRDFPEVLYMVDGAQSGGHVSIDMARDKIDVLCLAGHKGLGGIMGSGALLFSEAADIAPLTFGGTGSDAFKLDQPDYYPERLESGTLNLPAIVSLYEGVLATNPTMGKNAEKLVFLTETLISALKKTSGVKVYSQPNPCGIVAFSAENLPSGEYAELLSEKYDIAVRGGFHCAPLMHRYLETEKNGLVRISLSAENTERETAAFLAAAKELSFM
ncbi:MAG: aminotransferase class V-fold PLP-dependent enzyme [Clostridia bacterium]|nr:aminotransferase class V-fold PLP-dependent enzyme [Clostridia bacterium]